MSRCFPFPPPAYVRNGFRGEALVESIKREEKKARKEKKERKKEKKEKKEKKDKKRKDRECGESEIKQPGHKKQRNDDGTEEYLKADSTKEFQKVDIDHHKRKGNETEHLEKSSLTEEQQLVGSQNSCDSTQNSNKRQKQSPSPPDDSRQNNNSESIIRIRLPVKRQKFSQVLADKEQQPCFSHGRVDAEAAYQPASFVPDRQRAVLQKPCSTSTDTALVSFDKEKRNNINSAPQQPTLKLCKEGSNKEKLHRLPELSKPSRKLDSLTSRKPEPLTSRKPEPLTSRKSEPSTSRKPEPSTSRKPEPLISRKPESLISRKPEPSTLRKPEPSTLRKPEPSTSRQPEPLTSRLPGPSTSRKPELSTSRQPELSTSTKPVPLTSRKPEPSTSRQPELLTSTKPEPSTSRQPELSTSTKSELVQTPNLRGTCPPSVALQFQELVENWVPPSVHEISTDADDGWLLRSKKPIPSADRRETSSCGMNQEHPTATWPKACFLPEADLYVLPYTVPF